MTILEADNSFITQMALLFSQDGSRQSFLEQAVACIKKYTGAECAGIRVMDKDGYIPYEAYLGYTHDFWQRENWLSIIKDNCVCTRVATGNFLPADYRVSTPRGSFYTGTCQEFAAALSDDEKACFRGACIDYGFETVAAVRIVFRGTTVGVIHLADKHRDAFSPGQVSVIETTAPMIGAVVNYEHLQNSFSRLSEVHLVGEFAANLGHEVRNPLTAAHGMAQFLRRKKGLEPYEEYFEMIISQLDLSNSILKEFLTLAKNKLISQSPLDLNKLIADFFTSFQPEAAGRGARVEFEPGDIAFILADESEIKRLIHNLASNGLDAAGPDGGLLLRTYSDGDAVILAVADTGSGIEPSHFHRIGKPFFSTKQGNAGLGLSVCYAIAARNGADIEFKTDKRGTTFFVRFANKRQ